MSINFFEMIKNKLNLSLDTNQVKAASHFNGPALVLAVPGSGKTTVLITRIAYLTLCKDIPASQILSITFSRSSAIDMKNRFSSIYGDFNINPKFSTIHSFSYMVLRDYFSKNNLNYSLIESSDNISQSMILRELYKKETNNFLSDDKLEELINSIGYIKNMMISPDDYKVSSFPNFKTLYDLYDNYKKTNNLLDFDDMLSMTLDVLKKDEEILSKYKSRYKYIQVDEGQDTSNIQHKIIEILAYPNNNIFIVADDDQSIYGFRGANPKYLLNFKDRYNDSKIFNLDTNYRSNKSIVNISNNFISQNKDRYHKQLKAFNTSESKINTLVFDSQEEEYDYILDNLDTENLSNNAILFRNNISAISLVDKLDRLGIDFMMKEIKLSFFNHWITSDILAFFSLILNDSDKSAFEKIYYKMNAFISKKAMNYVINDNSSDSVFNILEGYGELKSFQKRNLRNLGIKLKRIAKNKPIEIIDYIEMDLDYLDYLKKRADYLGQNLDTVLVYLSTIRIIASRTESIPDFLHRIEELKNIILSQKKNDGVYLSTIHSAKGLEFDNVFLIDLINGEFPSANSLELNRKEEYEELEEERRVFYVGITRAKSSLHLVSFKNRGVNLAAPSDFLFFMDKYGSNKIKKTSNKLSFGDTVKHKTFGNGKIIAIDREYIMINFENHGSKSFSRKLVEEKHLIIPSS